MLLHMRGAAALFSDAVIQSDGTAPTCTQRASSMDPTEFVSGICKTRAFDFDSYVSTWRGLESMINQEGVCPNLVSALLLSSLSCLRWVGCALGDRLQRSPLWISVQGARLKWVMGVHLKSTSFGKPTAQVWCVQVAGWDIRFNLEHIEAFRPRLLPQVRQEGTCQAPAAIVEEEEPQTCS